MKYLKKFRRVIAALLSVFIITQSVPHLVVAMEFVQSNEQETEYAEGDSETEQDMGIAETTEEIAIGTAENGETEETEEVTKTEPERAEEAENLTLKAAEEVEALTAAAEEEVFSEDDKADTLISAKLNLDSGSNDSIVLEVDGENKTVTNDIDLEIELNATEGSTIKLIEVPENLEVTVLSYLVNDDAENATKLVEKKFEDGKVIISADEISKLASDVLTIHVTEYEFGIQMSWDNSQDGIIIEDLLGTVVGKNSDKEDIASSFSLNGNQISKVDMDLSNVNEVDISFEDCWQGVELVNASLVDSKTGDVVENVEFEKNEVKICDDDQWRDIQKNETIIKINGEALKKVQGGYYILNVQVEAPNTFSVVYTKRSSVQQFLTKLNKKYGDVKIEEYSSDGEKKGCLVVQGKNNYYVSSAETDISYSKEEYMKEISKTYETDPENSGKKCQVVRYMTNERSGRYAREFVVTMSQDFTSPVLNGLTVEYKNADKEDYIKLETIENTDGSYTVYVPKNEDVNIALDVSDSEVGVDEQNISYAICGESVLTKSKSFSLGAVDKNVQLVVSVPDYLNNIMEVPITICYDDEPPVLASGEYRVNTDSVKVSKKNDGTEYWGSDAEEPVLLVNVKETSEPLKADYAFYELKADGELGDLVGEQSTELLVASDKKNDLEADGYAWYQLKLDLESIFGEKSFKDVDEGKYVLYAVITDKAQNRTGNSKLVTFEINRHAPIATMTVGEKDKLWIRSVDGNATASAHIQFFSASNDNNYYYAVTSASGDEIRNNNIKIPTDEDMHLIENSKILNGEVDIQVELPMSDYKETNGTVRFCLWVYDKALDSAGRIYSQTFVDYNIDNTKPEISSMEVEKTSSNESLKDRIYRYVFGTILNKDESLKVVIWAEDVEAQDAVYLEENQPQITDVSLYYIMSSSIEDEKWNSMGVGEQYQWLQNNKVKEEEVQVNEKKEGIYTASISLDSEDKFYKLYVTATDLAGNTTVKNVAELTENQDESCISQIMVDSKKPTITTDLQSGVKADYVEERDGKEYNWYAGSSAVSYDVIAQDKQSGIFSVNVSVNGTELKKDKNGNEIYDFNNLSKKDEAKLIKKCSYTVDLSQGKLGSDGKAKLTVKVTDNAGNSRSASPVVYVDEDAPAISCLEFETGSKDTLDTVPTQYGYFFQKETTVKIYATDYIGTTDNIGSGVAKMAYQLLPADGSAVTGSELEVSVEEEGTYVAQFVIPEGFKGQIQVKAVDHVGQDSGYFNPKGAVVETPAEHEATSEVKTVLPETDFADAEGNPLYTSDVILQLEAADGRSGLKETSWNVREHYAADAMAAGTLQISSVFDENAGKFASTLSGDVDGWNIPNELEMNLVTSAQKSVTVSSEKNHIAANILITDNAGNVSNASEKVFSIDRTAPVVTVEYDNNNALNETYYQEKRVATITVTDANFSEEGCAIEVTGPAVNISGWTHHAANGCDGSVHTGGCYYTCQIEFVEDGDYTFNFKCTDRAGHTAGMDVPDEFTIDKEKPVISVSYDNNAGETNYYSASRTATIEVTDKNFDPAATQVDVTAALEGNGIAAPQASAFTQNGDVWSAQIDFAEDGDYSLHVTSTDKAGNIADEYAVEEFTVDTTMPEVTISGVENHSANNGVIEPVVHCSDININAETINVTLTGANNGATVFESSKVVTGNDVTISIADLAHKAELDDLYTLETSVTDQAGNETVESILFSVNRFGSVYVIDDETKNLVEKFYANEEQDVVIKEINVDILQYSEINYSLDGEIVTLNKDEDYTVTSSTDEASWKMYEYHIGKENFKKEGSYVVSIYSEDLAQNKSSNKAKGDELAFVIDKTAPTIVVGGIEDNGQYMDAKRNVTVDTQDNILLDNVEVYVGDVNQASANQEQLVESNGQVSLAIDGANKSQELYVVAKDAAGNMAVSDSIRFLITKNLFVQWYSNIPLCVGSSTAVVGITSLVAFRRRIWHKRQTVN